MVDFTEINHVNVSICAGDFFLIFRYNKLRFEHALHRIDALDYFQGNEIMIKKTLCIGLLCLNASLPVLAYADQAQPVETGLSSFGRADNFPQSSLPRQRLVLLDAKKKSTSLNQIKKSDNVLSNVFGLEGRSKIKINGFLSAGFGKTDARNNAKYAFPDRGALSDKVDFIPSSSVGLQITTQLVKWADVVFQLTADGDDDHGEVYEANTELAFLRLRSGKALQMHIGRFRLPLFLYSETQQVGYTYPWQYLPNAVYRLTPFTNMNGMSLLYTKPLGLSNWTMKWDAFWGSNKSQYQLDNPTSTMSNFDEDNILGGGLRLGNDQFTLRGAYAHLDFTNNDNTVSSKNASLWSVGSKMNIAPMFFIAEYGHRNMSTNQLLTMSGYYLTAGFRQGKFMPAITYSSVKTDNTPTGSPRENAKNQRSLSASVDYYVSPRILTKVSFSRITPKKGTSGFFNVSPGKKSVYIFGAEIDAVF